MWWLTVVGLLIAAVGSVAGVLALFPDRTPSVDATLSPVPGVTVGPATPGTPATLPSTTPAETFLSTLTPQAGMNNLVKVPQPFRADPAYGRAIAVQCPSNQNDDKLREVTYQVRGRYLSLAAVIQPSFLTHADAQVHVFVIAAYRQLDGTLDRREVGSQFGATGELTQPLRAGFDGAEELTIRVRCEDPDGVVIVQDARLTHA